MKPFGKDTNQRVWTTAEYDRLSYGGAVAMVAAHPKRVADDRDRRCAGPIFSREESTPESGSDTEHVEDPGTRARAAHPLRLFTAGEREPRG